MFEHYREIKGAPGYYDDNIYQKNWLYLTTERDEKNRYFIENIFKNMKKCNKQYQFCYVYFQDRYYDIAYLERGYGGWEYELALSLPGDDWADKCPNRNCAKFRIVGSYKSFNEAYSEIENLNNRSDEELRKQFKLEY